MGLATWSLIGSFAARRLPVHSRRESDDPSLADLLCGQANAGERYRGRHRRAGTPWRGRSASPGPGGLDAAEPLGDLPGAASAVAFEVHSRSLAERLQSTNILPPAELRPAAAVAGLMRPRAGPAGSAQAARRLRHSSGRLGRASDIRGRRSGTPSAAPDAGRRRSSMGRLGSTTAFTAEAALWVAGAALIAGCRRHALERRRAGNQPAAAPRAESAAQSSAHTTGSRCSACRPSSRSRPCSLQSETGPDGHDLRIPESLADGDVQRAPVALPRSGQRQGCVVDDDGPGRIQDRGPGDRSAASRYTRGRTAPRWTKRNRVARRPCGGSAEMLSPTQPLIEKRASNPGTASSCIAWRPADTTSLGNAWRRAPAPQLQGQSECSGPLTTVRLPRLEVTGTITRTWSRRRP